MNDKVNKKVLLVSGALAGVFVLCAVLVGIFELAVRGIAGQIDFIDAGKRWAANGERYAVISLYTEESAALTKDQVESWVYSIDSALLEASITLNENARSWAYTYAAEETMSVTGPKATATAEIIAAGGDFFVFHPLQFLYGAAFLNDTSNPNGVVIDEDLAWKIFGAVDIVGMEMTINDTPFTVVGVTERESDHGIYAYTYGERPRMYMSYAGYIKVRGDEAHITIFETALPNAVKSFAKNIFSGVVQTNEESTSVSEASDRFSLLNRYNNMKILKYSWIRENKIEYPYWENEALVADYRCAILMIFEIALAAISVTAMLISFVLLRVSGYTFTDSAKNIYHKLEKKYGGKKRSTNFKHPKICRKNEVRK